jgi:hypothetical protein
MASQEPDPATGVAVGAAVGASVGDGDGVGRGVGEGDSDGDGDGDGVDVGEAAVAGFGESGADSLGGTVAVHATEAKTARVMATLATSGGERRRAATATG